jgi:hypothetical protein
MTTSRVDVERVGADVVLRLWHESTNTSVFTHPEVLSALAHDVHWWLATTSGEPASLWPVCVDAEGRVTPPEFAYYLGPFEVGPVDPSPRRRLMRSVAVQHALLETLCQAYETLSWSTLPGQHELRPWLWFDVRGRRPVARPRYTAVIDRLAGASDEDIVRRFSSERRNQCRRAEKSGAMVMREVPLARLSALYCETMRSSGAGDLARRRLREVEALYELVMRGHGFFVPCGQDDQDIVRAVWLVLVGKGRACGVLAVSDAGWRNDCFNAFGQHRALVAARDRGVLCYDFNGANSFSRGADKHSYGAEAELYFDLEV